MCALGYSSVATTTEFFNYFIKVVLHVLVQELMADKEQLYIRVWSRTAHPWSTLSTICLICFEAQSQIGSANMKLIESPEEPVVFLAHARVKDEI